jgi:hypothetical protein
VKEAKEMKIAKTFAILLASVLVVICFNAPFVHSVEGDGHPWDGESGDGGGGTNSGGHGQDTTIIIFRPDAPTRSDLSPMLIRSAGLERIQSVLYFLVWYRDIPCAKTARMGQCSQMKTK